MSTELAYELHSFSGGRWKIQGFFDDRDLAVSEAHRMEEARRFPAVRVVEERFDPETGGYKSRTVYRSSAVDQHNETALKERADTRREVEATRSAPAGCGRQVRQAAELEPGADHDRRQGGAAVRARFRRDLGDQPVWRRLEPWQARAARPPFAFYPVAFYPGVRAPRPSPRTLRPSRIGGQEPERCPVNAA
ncbi:MAG: hypothetical protein U5L06_03440 [Rhodovibrio sp.]|nr:hypothetical protein [Rhodovibrio sp.]